MLRAIRSVWALCRLPRITLALGITLGSLALAQIPPASAATGTFTIVPVPPILGTPCICQGITTGSDHNLWFTEFGNNIIGRSTVTGTVTQRLLPFSIAPAGEDWIASGPDGNLWVTLKDSIAAHSKIARISTNFARTIFPIPGASIVEGITAGPDGALWFTDRLGKVDRISTTGTVTEFSTGSQTQPYQIISGPDGNLWFTDFNGRIGRITPRGQVTLFALPMGGLQPDAITRGPDGALWFTTDGQNAQIGRITTAGIITLFPLPHLLPVAVFVFSQGIVTGPDGNLWFTIDNSPVVTPLRDRLPNALGRITTTGQVSEVFIPSPPAQASLTTPLGLTVGPDNALWFGIHVGEIGRFVIG